MPLFIATTTGDIQRPLAIAHCPICLTTIGSNRQDEALEFGILLTCGHLFGHDCVGRWFSTRNTSCPSCRAEVESEIREQVLRMRGLVIIQHDLAAGDEDEIHFANDAELEELIEGLRDYMFIRNAERDEHHVSSVPPADSVHIDQEDSAQTSRVTNDGINLPLNVAATHDQVEDANGLASSLHVRQYNSPEFSNL